jgi:hypothetical protein
LRIDSENKYELILVNKNIEEIVEIQEKVMSRLFPKNTNMDFNIGVILHLVSQGRGVSYLHKTIT